MTESHPVEPGATDHTSLERVAVRKATTRLLPFLFILYVVAFLDRVNVGFAALQMNRDLGFSVTVYGFGAGLFFVSYALLEVPSNLVLVRVGTRRWLARIMITWGFVASAMAVVRGSSSFFTLRLLLGAAEAGFLPAVVYYLSRWFPAAERAGAVSLFMMGSPIAGILGGPAAGALLTLDGVLGLAGWQWLFLVEGIPAVLLGLMALRWPPDAPGDARWLTPGERAALSARLADDPVVAPQGPGANFGSVATNPTVWRLALVWFLLLLGVYGVDFWLPQLVRAMSGYRDVLVGFLSAVPPLISVAGLALVALHSDRTGERRIHIATPALFASIGLLTAAYARVPLTGLAGLSLLALGIRSAYGPFWALATSVLTAGDRAAAGGIALINSIGNLGGFLGPYIVGAVRDATGSFRAPLVALMLAPVGAACLALSLAEPGRRQRAVPI